MHKKEGEKKGSHLESSHKLYDLKEALGPGLRIRGLVRVLVNLRNKIHVPFESTHQTLSNLCSYPLQNEVAHW